MSSDAHHKTRTLCLAGVLHAFTHIYQVALLPLYLPIQADFKLVSEGQSTLLVTVMMMAYFLPSYPMGMLADRCSRKTLLGLGLLINGVGFIGLGFAPNYALALASVVVAGLGGSFFHPAATALVARLFPVGTGKALGQLGIGAGVGFFIGPIYAGWHAELTGNWRAPVLVLGALGVIAAGLFLWLAEEERVAPAGVPGAKPSQGLFPTPALWVFFIAAAVAFSLRDFVGSSMGTLGSLYLQHAHGFTLQHTGLALSGIFLAGTVSNPIFGHLSDRGRLRWTCVAMLLAMVAVTVFPHVPKGGTLPALMVYGFFFMASYPMVEAALMVSVPDAVRGRVFGLWITIGGLMGNLSHWLVGRWVEGIGDKANAPPGYYLFYGVLGSMLLLALAGLPCLHAIRKREHLDGGATKTQSAI